MAQEGITNYHAEYLNVTSQHWHPQSETFAGGDHLVTAVANGWLIANYEEETYWYEGMRSVRIYHFELVKDGDVLKMPVIANPYVERFLRYQAEDAHSDGFATNIA